MEMLTVKEAVERVNGGNDLKGVVLDKESLQQVNVRDAMVLSRGGIVVPEESLFYDDSEIEYDEDIDELVLGEEITGMSWEDKAKLFEEQSQAKEEPLVNLTTDQVEINTWIANNKSRLEEILKPVVIGLFEAERLVKGEG